MCNHTYGSRITGKAGDFGENPRKRRNPNCQNRLILHGIGFEIMVKEGAIFNLTITSNVLQNKISRRKKLNESI